MLVLGVGLLVVGGLLLVPVGAPPCNYLRPVGSTGDCGPLTTMSLTRLAVGLSLVVIGFLVMFRAGRSNTSKTVPTG
jgi:hypothetical protein